ncbi:DUF2306 domain-containing protein [Archangium minus]|uniref:DUF2306 domain-containing protein n=2 Tax=Archangium minus TaxID=83450 RepID=A0ABY9X970_9BACT|nr:DUF2306 domain-containing protein [Archangium minus]
MCRSPPPPTVPRRRTHPEETRMEALYSPLRLVHIACGAVAFATLWLPLVAKKGTLLHRKVGMAYVIAMLCSAATGMALSSIQVVRNWPAPSPMSFFLAYIGLISANAAVVGVRVLRFKQRTEAHRHPGDLALTGGTVLASLAIAGLGLHTGAMLLVAFAPVGLITGMGQLLYWVRPPRERMHWWYQHMGAMFGSGIATLTAFLVLNSRHFGGNATAIVFWLAPTLIGLPGARLWERAYRRRFAGKAVGLPAQG